jgi:hypothetical protein
VLPQVRETQKTIRDGRTGAESMTIARGMGQQVGLLLTVTRCDLARLAAARTVPVAVALTAYCCPSFCSNMVAEAVSGSCLKVTIGVTVSSSSSSRSATQRWHETPHAQHPVYYSTEACVLY